MKEMVLGFLFCPQGESVALIFKQRPSWQKGLLNGIGGHVEVGETPIQAMTREFSEETGARVDSWKKYAVMKGANWVVHVFKAFSNDVFNVKSITDEQVIICNPRDIKFDMVSNLDWLIPMALDVYDNFQCELTYQQEVEQLPSKDV